MSDELGKRARDALAHLGVRTPEQLRAHAAKMDATIEFCLICIPRCGWNTVIEIMDWCNEPLSRHAQLIANRRNRTQVKQPVATALAEAQAEIARLTARADRMEARIAVALFGLRGHEVLEPNRFHNGNRNDLIAEVLWDLCKASVAALTDKPDAGEG